MELHALVSHYLHDHVQSIVSSTPDVALPIVLLRCNNRRPHSQAFVLHLANTPHMKMCVVAKVLCQRRRVVQGGHKLVQQLSRSDWAQKRSSCRLA